MSNKPDTQKIPYNVLFILCLASFMAPFMGSSFNLAMPHIATAFSLKAVTLTWFTTGFMISTAIFQIPMAKIADMIGRKKIFMIGMLGLSATMLASPFSPSGYILIAFRILSGLFSAMMMGTNMAILVSSMPFHFRARALAINTASVYSALAVGPLVGGLLTEHAGWNSIFFVFSAMIFFVFIMAVIFLKGEWIEAKGEKFDFIGSIIYAFSLVGIIFGFTKLPHAIGFISLTAGITALIIFVLFEKKTPSPIIDMKLFITNRVFSMSCLATLINYAANAGMGFMLSLYLQYIRGYTASAAGLIFISQAIVQVVVSLASGELSAKFNPAKLSTYGMALCAAGLAGFILVTPDTPIYMIVSCLIFLGAGFGLFSSPNTNVIMSSVDKKHYGQASATTGTSRLTGQAFSMGIAGMTISLHVGNQQILPELYPEFMQSFHTTFIIFVILCLVGIIASASKNKYIPPKENDDAA